jgi:hypothetical protein
MVSPKPLKKALGPPRALVGCGDVVVMMVMVMMVVVMVVVVMMMVVILTLMISTLSRSELARAVDRGRARSGSLAHAPVAPWVSIARSRGRSLPASPSVSVVDRGRARSCGVRGGSPSGTCDAGTWLISTRPPQPSWSAMRVRSRMLHTHMDCSHARSGGGG